MAVVQNYISDKAIISIQWEPFIYDTWHTWGSLRLINHETVYEKRKISKSPVQKFQIFLII